MILKKLRLHLRYILTVIFVVAIPALIEIICFQLSEVIHWGNFGMILSIIAIFAPAFYLINFLVDEQWEFTADLACLQDEKTALSSPS